MTRHKCGNCGLVNFATDETCRRCGSLLARNEEVQTQTEPEVGEKAKKRGLGQRVLWITGMTLAIVLVLYVSLLITSDELKPEQQATVQKAIDVLDQKGFGSEVFVLRHLASYRATDNWWNLYIGHRDAYAATNFPFGENVTPLSGPTAS